MRKLFLFTIVALLLVTSAAYSQSGGAGGGSFSNAFLIPTVLCQAGSTSSGSTNSIQIGAHSSLGGIHGTINISNTSGQSSVVIDDSNDGSRQISVTDHSVVYGDLASMRAAFATVNYQAAVQENGMTVGVTALTLDDADAPNLIDVISVGPLTDTSLKWYAPDFLFGKAKNLIHLI